MLSSWQEFYSNKEITIMVLLESQIKLKTGDNAPIFQLLGVDNKKHALNDYNNFQGILIIFMCNHCPYVKSKIETLNELYEKFSNKIAIIGINSNDSKDYPEDSFENMKKMAKENEFKFDYLLDETQEIAKKYGAICTPDSFLFNSKKQPINQNLKNKMLQRCLEKLVFQI